MKNFLAFIFTLLLCSSYAQSGDVKTEIKRIILHDTELSLSDTPGFIIGIIDQDSTYIVDFGSSIKGEEVSIQPEDIYEVGSITKVFTTALVSILVEEGIINYDDKINSFLPIELQNPRMDEVTILNLIHHTSGFPVRPYFFGRKESDPQNPYAYYSKEDFLAFYTQFIPENIGEFNYSHTNYGFLEILLEQATKKPFDRLMQEYIFDPLGLDDSFVFFKETKNEIVSPGYDRAGRSADPWTFASFGASEGVRTNLNNLLRFVKMHMGLIEHPYADILKQNTNADIQTNFNDFIYSGKGWQIIKQKKNYDIITHNGKTSGHHGFIAFVKETKTGVVILSNSSIGTMNLGYLILRMINFNWKRKS